MASLRAARSDKPEICNGQFGLVPVGPRDESPFIECLPHCALLSQNRPKGPLSKCHSRQALFSRTILFFLTRCGTSEYKTVEGESTRADQNES